MTVARPRPTVLLILVRRVSFDVEVGQVPGHYLLAYDAGLFAHTEELVFLSSGWSSMKEVVTMPVSITGCVRKFVRNGTLILNPWMQQSCRTR